MVRHKLEQSDWELDENQAGSYEEMKIVIFHHWWQFYRFPVHDDSDEFSNGTHFHE